MRARVKRLVVVVWLALAATGAAAAGQVLDHGVSQVLRGNDLRQTTVSVMIVDLSTGQEVASINADEPMIPASNMKLFTTAAALEILKSDFKFQTRLALIKPEDWAAQSKQLNLEADPRLGPSLVILGDGDPALGDPEVLESHKLTAEDLLNELVKAVQRTGVTSLDRLIVDDRVFDRVFVHKHWPENQLQLGYCAQVGGVNFYNNVIDIWPEPTSLNKPPRIVLKPDAPFIQTTNNAVTDRNDNFIVKRPLGGESLIFDGFLGTRKTIPYQVTIHEPPMYMARLLADRLSRAGIQVGSVERAGEGDLLPQGQVIYTVRTTLFEVIQRCNTESINLYAECLLKRMGREFTGAPGTWSNGASAVRDFLQRRLGTAAAAVVIDDGSGMSRENRVTARVLVKLLQSMHDDPQLRLDYIQSLAVAGESGTLQKRLSGTQGRVFAKTGYINGVSAFSGYLFLPTPEGKQEHPAYAFSLLFNNVPPSLSIGDVKRVQDQIIKLLDSTPQVTAAQPQ